MNEIRIVVYTTEMEDLILQGVERFRKIVNSIEGTFVCVQVFNKREDLLYSVRENDYAVVVVAENGASGFEAVLGIRNFKSLVPLIWITSDEVFGVQSYRMHVQDFLVTPIQPRQVSDSLKKCMEYYGGKRK